MEKQLIYLFLGDGAQVGKTYRSKLFAKEHGFKHGTTSDIIIESFAKELHLRFSDLLNVKSWETVFDQIKANKESWRPWLVWYGNCMCDDDPSCLAVELVNRGCNVIDGIRRQKELYLVMDKYNCVVYWVKREGYPKILDNTEIRITDNATIIQNNF